MTAFWIGVASSISAWLIGLLITYHGIPLVQGVLWSITNISGKWAAYHADPSTGALPVGVASIKQRGPRVTMTLHRNRDANNNVVDRNYSYKGTFRGRQLTLVWQAIDRPDSRVGAMVLHLSEDSQTFEGKTVFYSDDLHGSPGVGSKPYWLRRAPR